MVLDAIRFTEALQPRLVFFENVPGLGKQPVFRKLAQGLAKLGYKLSEPRQVDAADLGVPQRRQRMILVAAKDEKLLQDATNINFVPRRTVRQAIASLPMPSIGIESIEGDALHYARVHAPITIERLRHIPFDGGSRDSLPDNLQLACHKKLAKPSLYPNTPVEKTLFFEPKPRNQAVFEFKSTAGNVIATKKDKDLYLFSATRNKFYWLGDLKDPLAQSIVGKISDVVGSVGINPYEWQRRQGK